MPPSTTLRLTPDGAPIELTGPIKMLGGGSPDDVPRFDDAVTAATVDAMAAPLGLPPLRDCFTSDDRVAIALGAGVPQAVAVLRGVVTGLAEAAIDARQVTVVASVAADANTLTEELADQVAAGLKIVAHDPADEDNLCFAGVDLHDEPLRLNRQLFEADAVLPVTCAHAPGHPDSHGAFGGVYPAFGDADALRRLKLSDRRHDKEIEHAGWVLGAPIALQVAPGQRGGIDTVFAGETQQVEREAAARCEQLWACPAMEPASLVVVTLGTQQPAWSGVCRALDLASRLTTPGGAIAITTHLDEPPPQALIELAAEDDAERTLGRLATNKSPDLALAQRVAATLEEGPLYLMSHLDPDDVESLGMAPLADVNELQHLIASRPSVLVVEDAEHVVATLGEEATLEA